MDRPQDRPPDRPADGAPLHRFARRAGMVALLAAPMLALGCASGEQASLVSGPPVIGEDGPASAKSLDAKFTHALTSGTEGFAAHEGPGAPGTIIFVTAKRAESSGNSGGESWIVTRRAMNEEAPYLTETYTRTADGSVALAESINAKEGVISRFDPPMVVAPARLTPGSPAKQSLTLTVHPIRDPTAVRDKGAATHEVTYLGDARVGLAGQAEVSAAHIRSVFRAKLSSASVVNSSDAWRSLPSASASEPQGLLVQSDDERASFLGMQVRANRAMFSRIGATTADPAPGPAK